MAQNGGPRALPRAHRSRAHIMSVPAPRTAPLTPLRPAQAVTLAVPRPESDRITNEYVETPIRVPAPSPPPQPRPTRLHLPPLPPSSATTTTPPVTKQPLALGKEQADCPSRPSIMCRECGRCRCESCQQPRPLPQKWLCNNHCLCSADAIVDTASCLCCVKGCFYHCSESDGGSGGASCADEPCGCAPHKRLARWSCLAISSLALPCLLCYWPLRCCQRGVEAAYARHSRQGCRCRPPVATPEKRLLDSSPDF